MPPFLARPARALRAAAWLACLALAPAAASTNSESSYAARQGFAFAVLGGVPAHVREETVLAQVLGQIGHEADLAIHVGNLKGRDERCDDALYLRRRALLAASPVPLVLAPGESDWADCDREAAGRYGPVERLNRLRELFFESDRSLGQLQLDLQRQSETVRFRGYPENARWEYGDVLFVTLNVPGNHNNFRSGAGRNGEYEDRVLADSYWLRHAFGTAARLKTRGIVIAFRADPHFDGRRDVAANGGDPYAGLKADLARLASRYPGQVLVVHGGDAQQAAAQPDRPLKLNGRALDNVIRIRSYGSPRPAYWLKVSVEPGRKAVFRIETVNTVLAPPQPR